MTSRHLYCRTIIERGPRAGQLCGLTAVAIVTAMFRYGTPVCGIHRKAYTKQGVARIAYWNPKSEAWL